MNNFNRIQKTILKCYFELGWMFGRWPPFWEEFGLELNNLSMLESAGLIECLQRKLNIMEAANVYHEKDELIDPFNSAMTILYMNVMGHFWKNVTEISLEDHHPIFKKGRIDRLISQLPFYSLLMLNDTPNPIEDQIGDYAKDMLNKALVNRLQSR